MGERAQVPIEPPEQTALVDATMALPGVLIAGVPGGACVRVYLCIALLGTHRLMYACGNAAGGFDAVFVVALDASVLDRVEALWMAYPTATYVISASSCTHSRPITTHTVLLLLYCIEGSALCSATPTRSMDSVETPLSCIESSKVNVCTWCNTAHNEKANKAHYHLGSVLKIQNSTK